MRIFRMSRSEVTTLRSMIKENKKRLDDNRRCAIVAFAKLFGKFLPDYTRIVIA